MTAGPTEGIKKALPKTESVPMFMATALLVALGLVVAVSALVGDSDASLRRKVLGTWQVCPKDQACYESVFSADGQLVMKPSVVDLVMDLRFTWSIHNRVITLQLKGGGDWFSSAVASLAQLFGSRSAKVMHLPIRFEGDAVMYIGDGKLVRIGSASP